MKLKNSLIMFRLVSMFDLLFLIFILFAFMASCATASETNKLSITLMEPSEGQPHITVNDFAWIADAFIFPMLAGYPANASPDVNSATNGDMYIVPAAVDSATPEGDWSDHDNDLAVLRNDEWNFFTPAAGWTVYSASYTYDLTFNGTSWGAKPKFWAKQYIITQDYDDFLLADGYSYDLFIIPGNDSHLMSIQSSSEQDFFTIIKDTDGEPYVFMEDDANVTRVVIDAGGTSYIGGGNLILGDALDVWPGSSVLDVSGEITLRARPSTPSDPDTGASVLWMDAAGNLRLKTNPAGVVKEATLAEFSGL